MASIKIKKPFQIDEFDVNEILVSKKEPHGTKKALKYFIGSNDNDVIRPLCLRLSKMTGYIRKFKENTTTTITMSLRVNDTQLLKDYNKIWGKIKILISISFESEPIYGDKYIKTKKKDK